MSAAPPTVSPPEPALQQAARRLAEGRPDEAVTLLETLVREAPIYAAAHVLYATALGAAGRPREALDAWNQAAVLVPRSPVVLRERQKALDQIPPPENVAGPPDGATAEMPEAEMPEAEMPEAHTMRLDELVGPPAPDPPDPTPVEAPVEAPGDPVEWAEPALPPLDVLPPEEPASAGGPAPDEGAAEGWALIDEEIAAHGAHAPDAPAALLPPEGEAAPTGPPAATGFSVADELDLLISQLEDAPRIRPDPAYSGPAVTLDDSGVDDLASETLAKIYAAQNQFAQAALVYDKLAAQQPERAHDHHARAAEMRQRRGGAASA